MGAKKDVTTIMLEAGTIFNGPDYIGASTLGVSLTVLMTRASQRDRTWNSSYIMFELRAADGCGMFITATWYFFLVVEHTTSVRPKYTSKWRVQRHGRSFDRYSPMITLPTIA